MTEKNVQAIILAAGKSTRFNTNVTKLITPLCGQELILYPLKALAALDIPITLVVGHQKDIVINACLQYTLSPLVFIEQTEQKGTGHALAITQAAWIKEHVLVLNGDMPCVTPEIIEQLLQEHINGQAVASFVTAYNSDSAVRGYGRVIKTGQHIEIIEERHFTGNLQETCYINAGVYIFKQEFLIEAIKQLSSSTRQEL
jgi:bifunctional UDP-N-acetylglucosamine pyrophosphorylase / glucosamine-1-phosphate N-acetyltransferase